MEIRQTMKPMSILEKENRKRLEFMIPGSVIGRHQILDKLKDLTVDIDNVVIKPVSRIPSIIRKIEPFFSTDGYWYGNFIAYGTGLNNTDILLWDDVTIENMPHYSTMVDSQYVKERLDANKPATLIVSKNCGGKHVLEMYCYMP